MFVNMAGVGDTAMPQRLLSKGEYVNCGGKTCYIQDIVNPLGYNQYVLIDMDTGLVMKKARYEFTPIPGHILDEADDIPYPTTNNDDTKKNETTIEKQPSRFASVTAEDLDKIELNRNSTRTKMQTSWAIGVFKGESSMQQSSRS